MGAPFNSLLWAKSTWLCSNYCRSIPGPALVEVAQYDPDVLLQHGVQLAGDLVVEALGGHHVELVRLQRHDEVVVGLWNRERYSSCGPVNRDRYSSCGPVNRDRYSSLMKTDEIYSRVIIASDSQCRSRSCPGFDPSILRHSGIWGAADEAVMNSVHKKKISKKSPLDILHG